MDNDLGGKAIQVPATINSFVQKEFEIFHFCHLYHGFTVVRYVFTLGVCGWVLGETQRVKYKTDQMMIIYDLPQQINAKK